jgi:MFS family permease
VGNLGTTGRHPIRDIFTRDFILAFAALFAFILANYILAPTLPIYLERLGVRETGIGVLVGAFGASSLILRLLVGQALLTYTERQIMMAGAVLFAVTFFGFLVLPVFWPLFVVRLLQGVAFACLDTAVLAFVVRIVPPTLTAQGISYCLLAVNFSLASAPMLGMFVINRFSFSLLFMLGAALSLCALFFSSLVKGPAIAQPKVPTSRTGFAVNVKAIPPAIGSFLQNFIWGSLLAFVPLYAIKRGVSNPAPFFTAMAVTTIAGRLLGGRIFDMYDREKIVMTFMGTSALTCIALAFAKTLPVFIALGALWGFGAVFVFPILMALSMDRAGSSGGTAVGTFRALGDTGLTLGPVMMGIIIPLTSYPAMFLCLGLVSMINLSYFHFAVRVRKPSKVFS